MNGIPFFTVVLPAINHCFEVDVVKTGDEFSIIYIFIASFMNNAYPKFSNVSNFVFHCKKKQQKIGI